MLSRRLQILPILSVEYRFRTVPPICDESDLMNFLTHWSLQRAPFGPLATADAFFAGAPQREAIARLEYLIRSESRAALLLAERGCGTTTLLKRVSGTSGLGNAAVDAFVTCGPAKSPDVALARLAVEMSIDPFAPGLGRRLSEAIGASGRNQVRVLWMIDRCDPASAEAAASLAAGNRWLTTVLSTAPCDAANLSCWLDCCPLRVDLEPLSLDDSIGYLRYCLAMAGGREDIFEDTAAVRLHELSEGKLALLSAMAQVALLAAAALRVDTVSAQCVESAQHELVRAA